MIIVFSCRTIMFVRVRGFLLIVLFTSCPILSGQDTLSSENWDTYLEIFTKDFHDSATYELQYTEVQRIVDQNTTTTIKGEIIRDNRRFYIYFDTGANADRMKASFDGSSTYFYEYGSGTLNVINSKVQVFVPEYDDIFRWKWEDFKFITVKEKEKEHIIRLSDERTFPTYDSVDVVVNVADSTITGYTKYNKQGPFLLVNAVSFTDVLLGNSYKERRFILRKEDCPGYQRVIHSEE